MNQLPTPCSNEYDNVITLVKDKYEKNKALFERKNHSATYIYRIISITMYPFFCDSTIEIPKKDIKYGCEYMIRSYSDKSIHVWVPVLYYYEWVKNVEPDKKFYVMLYLTLNKKNDWVEEKASKVIILDITDRKKTYYGCE
jgi:hypothetical protein